MSLPVRVLSVGAGAPSLRLAAAEVGAAWSRGGRGQAAVCAPDEDTLTLAAEAGFAALAAAGIAPSGVDGLWWGTTRPPFARTVLYSAMILPIIALSMCSTSVRFTTTSRAPSSSATRSSRLPTAVTSDSRTSSGQSRRTTVTAPAWWMSSHL